MEPKEAGKGSDNREVNVFWVCVVNYGEYKRKFLSSELTAFDFNMTTLTG